MTVQGQLLGARHLSLGLNLPPDPRHLLVEPVLHLPQAALNLDHTAVAGAELSGQFGVVCQQRVLLRAELLDQRRGRNPGHAEQGGLRVRALQRLKFRLARHAGRRGCRQLFAEFRELLVDQRAMVDLDDLVLLPEGLDSLISLGHILTQSLKFALDPGRGMLVGSLPVSQVVLEVEIGEGVRHRRGGGRRSGVDVEVNRVRFAFVLYPQAGQDLVDHHGPKLLRRQLVRRRRAIHQPKL